MFSAIAIEMYFSFLKLSSQIYAWTYTYKYVILLEYFKSWQNSFNFTLWHNCFNTKLFFSLVRVRVYWSIKLVKQHSTIFFLILPILGYDRQLQYCTYCNAHIHIYSFPTTYNTRGRKRSETSVVYLISCWIILNY